MVRASERPTDDALRLVHDRGLPPALPAGGTYPTEAAVRPIMSLLGGMATSVAGLAVVIGSMPDFAGVLLIAAGVLVAAIGQRAPARERLSG